MGLGSVLAGLALALVATAYVARPFRQQEGVVTDDEIDAWVAQARRRAPAAEGAACRECDRPARSGDRFCSGCGAPLGEGE